MKAQWIIAGIIVAAMAVPAASTAGKPTRQTPEERLTQALKDMEAGTSTSCIPARQQGSTSVFGNTILYRQSARLLWRNDTGGHCGRRDDILVTRVHGSSLCRGDIVTTIDRSNGFHTGSCVLGDFVPYRKKAD